MEVSRRWGRQPHLPAHHPRRWSLPSSPWLVPGRAPVGQSEVPRSQVGMGRTQGTGRTLSLSPDTVNLSPGSHPGQAPGSGTQVRLQTPVGPGVGGTQRVWGGLGEPEAKDPPMSGVQGKTLRPRPPGGQAGGGASSSGTQGPAPLTAPPRLRGRVQTAPSSGQRPTSEGEWPWGSAPCFPSCSVAPHDPWGKSKPAAGAQHPLL